MVNKNVAGGLTATAFFFQFIFIYIGRNIIQITFKVVAEARDGARIKVT